VEPRPDDEAVQPGQQDVDASGVDRAQIREFLALAPDERLQRVEELVGSILEIRELNAAPPPR
jgi:hypothetical protein